jgi:hypothetical protein
MIERETLGTTIALLMLTTVGTAAADGTHRCATIADDQARLQCYDAAFGKPSPGGSPTATTASAPTVAKGGTQAPVAASTTAAVAAAPVTTDAAARARDEFGLSEVDKRARKTEQEVAPTSISGQIAQLASRPTGELVVTLADGQVWVQVDVDARFRAKAGDAVTIRKATLGSYLMVGPNRIATRVRRVK